MSFPKWQCDQTYKTGIRSDQSELRRLEKPALDANTFAGQPAANPAVPPDNPKVEPVGDEPTPFSILDTNPDDGVTVAFGGQEISTSVRFDQPIDPSTLPTILSQTQTNVTPNQTFDTPIEWIPNPTPSGPNEYIVQYTLAEAETYVPVGAVEIDYSQVLSLDGAAIQGDSIINFDVISPLA